ncbi:hypothetical protein PALU110988_22985 [Paenibacillus lupini]|uniref:hypothetical protein n=1 Tax=Paenibacillus lupini TaxID=1450204 RepID=UPI00141FC8F3|nr:hypothetical protein [Paenibacillus lupini]NIK21687.1 hypothetical protein [Paenibacillus lupini]
MQRRSFQFNVRHFHGITEWIADVQPISNKSNKFLVLTKNSKIYELDTKNEVITELFSFDSEGIIFDENVSLLVSAKGELIAVYNTFGSHGIVIDVQTKSIIMRFNRDDYHSEQTVFPVAFTYHNKQILLIHGTKWNRLDITNPLTHEVFSKRNDPKFELSENKSTESEHYLDYFHGQLLVSPDYKWIVDNGWEWHPAGCVTGWSISEWLQNRWESEDGKSKMNLWSWKEDWNDPVCWISNNEIGLVGRHNSDFIDENEIFDDRCLFRKVDVSTGDVLNEFPIAPGNIYYDAYLFSCSKDVGIKIYDVNSGELQYENKELIIDNYHHKSKEFIRYDNEQIIIYRLIEEINIL